jgi:hypothetical protein
MLKGLDDIGSMLEHEKEIAAFERGHAIPPPVVTGTVDMKASNP